MANLHTNNITDENELMLRLLARYGEEEFAILFTNKSFKIYMKIQYD